MPQSSYSNYITSNSEKQAHWDNIEKKTILMQELADFEEEQVALKEERDALEKEKIALHAEKTNVDAQSSVLTYAIDRSPTYYIRSKEDLEYKSALLSARLIRQDELINSQDELISSQDEFIKNQEILIQIQDKLIKSQETLIQNQDSRIKNMESFNLADQLIEKIREECAQCLKDLNNSEDQSSNKIALTQSKQVEMSSLITILDHHNSNPIVCLEKFTARFYSKNTQKILTAHRSEATVHFLEAINVLTLGLAHYVCNGTWSLSWNTRTASLMERATGMAAPSPSHSVSPAAHPG